MTVLHYCIARKAGQLQKAQGERPLSFAEQDLLNICLSRCEEYQRAEQEDPEAVREKAASMELLARAFREVLAESQER
jgi:hypothetical protein